MSSDDPPLQRLHHRQRHGHQGGPEAGHRVLGGQGRVHEDVHDEQDDWGGRCYSQQGKVQKDGEEQKVVIYGCYKHRMEGTDAILFLVGNWILRWKFFSWWL